MSIWYKPGKNMIFADHLSRNVNPKVSKVPTIPGLNLEVSSLELSAIPSKLECITQQSECDPPNAYTKKSNNTGLAKRHKPMPVAC